jgi:hypothetical protein
MAQVVVTELVDDLDGSDAEETVTFAWKGYTYEIDLSVKNLARLDKAMAPFVAKARRVGRAARPGSRSTKTKVPSDAAAVRAWALANGYDVPGRGRIPNDVREAHAAATT